MPGKRKRDEDADGAQDEVTNVQHGSTVFISNLPYTATSTDVKTLFSDIAPIKNAFVVLEKETKVSKGVGYVTFAMREDAAQCVENGEVEMNGRTLRVTWAGVKPKPGEEAPPKVSNPAKRVNVPAKPKVHDVNAVRTITITGLADSVDSKAIWKKVRKQDGAESVIFPAPHDEDGSEDPTKAHVLFSTTAQAQKAVERLNAHVFKGSVLGVTLKKRLDKRPNGSSRLIVRNLPWNITESDLRALFLPYGVVYSVNIPFDSPAAEDEQRARKPKAKGFAFVWMLTKADAEKALEGANGKIINTRPIAVDWALSKDKWESTKEPTQVKDEDGSRSPSDSGSSTDSSTDEDDPDQSEGGLGVHSDVTMNSGDDDNEEDEDRGDPTKPELPPPEAGTTLFIRNVPWEATEDDMRQLLRAFGPLRYVRIVMDHESQRSKGSAFACFWKKEDADKVIAISEALSKEAGTETAMKNPFSTPSMLAPDPSSSLARNLVIHGRTLDVVRAVTRETATKLRDAGEKIREKADKRNLYLMREGVIFPNSPAASTLPSAELEKRINSFNQRRALLRSNPSLYVSKTRLSIRQLPTFATERSLKRLALHAIREFDKEVKENARDPLAEDEVDDGGQKSVADSLMGEKIHLPQKRQEEPNTNSSAGGRNNTKRKGAFSKVKQAKIVRTADRVDPMTGKGRSKGYGFLETEKHSDALKVLRWANNNPDVYALLKSLWSEEMKDLAGVLEKKAKKDEEEMGRLKRLKAALNGEEGEEKGSKRTLAVEFSIENVIVVKKREGRDAPGSTAHRGGKREAQTIENEESGSSERKIRKDGRSKKRIASDETDSRPSKRVKREDGNKGTPSLAERIGDEVKKENPLGSMIGRKRRMKKANSGGRRK